MEIRWSILASQDIERIFWRIREHYPAAAREVIRTLYDGCSALADFPYSGRAGRMEGRRELVFPAFPYIVVYRVKENTVEISRIFHAAQDWP